jgi:threonine synthase
VKGVVQGFKEIARGLPKVVIVQAEGCAPIVRSYDRGESTVVAWGIPNTIASGISDPLIGYERDGTYTLRLARETQGFAVAVSDDEIRSAMQALAHKSGVLAEPTGASSVAALRKLSGRIEAGSRVVCLITGHGFKDFKVFRELPTQVFDLESSHAEQAVARSLEGFAEGKKAEAASSLS